MASSDCLRGHVWSSLYSGTIDVMSPSDGYVAFPLSLLCMTAVLRKLASPMNHWQVSSDRAAKHTSSALGGERKWLWLSMSCPLGSSSVNNIHDMQWILLTHSCSEYPLCSCHWRQAGCHIDLHLIKTTCMPYDANSLPKKWIRCILYSIPITAAKNGCIFRDVGESNKPVKCWDSNSMGTKGYIKEGLELTPMGSFDVGQGGCQLWAW